MGTAPELIDKIYKAFLEADAIRSLSLEGKIGITPVFDSDSSHYRIQIVNDRSYLSFVVAMPENIK